jgi:ABC-type dipeptide/oligopeptide/nickel transport system permease subunit
MREETTAKSSDRALTPARLALRSLRRNRAAMLGLVIVAAFSLIAALAPVLGLPDPHGASLTHALESPSREHPFGRDELGRDLLSRVVHGARISLTLGMIAMAIGGLVGVPIGALSGYYGGRFDLIVQRLVDILLAFPGTLLAIVVVTILGVGLDNVMIAIGIASIPTYVRLARGSVLSVKEIGYVAAARAVGGGDRRIVFRHVLPNCLGPLIVQSTFQIATAILWAAGLGFLGLGAQAPTPEWGTMLSRGRLYMRVAPHLTAYPGLAIFAVVLGFNLLGDGLRDALDPRLRKA